MLIEISDFETTCPLCKGLTTHSQWDKEPCTACKGIGKLLTNLGYNLDAFLKRRGYIKEESCV